MKVSDVMNQIKSGIATSEEQKKEIITGLGADQAHSIESIRDALEVIKTQFEQDAVPYATIEIGLNHVMKILKEHEDLSLELEPWDISTIVQSYMALTDEEVRTVFDKASKTKKGPKASHAVDRVLKAAKENKGAVPDLDSDELIL